MDPTQTPFLFLHLGKHAGVFSSREDRTPETEKVFECKGCLHRRKSGLPQNHSWKGRKTESESEMVSRVMLTEYQNNKHPKQTGQWEQAINQNTCGNRTSLGLKKGTLLHKLVISTRFSLPPSLPRFFFFLLKKMGLSPNLLIRKFFPYCTCLSKSPSAVICY